MIDPVIFYIGSLEIRWYGLIMALSFLVGSFIAIRLGRSRELSKDNVYDFLVYLIPLSIIFARLFHVFFYNYSYYLENPGQIIQIWRGGVSLYGGLLGAFVAAIIFSWRKKIKLLDLADIFIIPFSFGIIFGRIGNFINQELYGKVTNLPWAVQFDNVQGLRHPTQIYEAIGHLIIFLVLLLVWRKKYSKGIVFFGFLGIYSIFRFFMEFLREDTAVLFGLTRTQVLIPFVLVISCYFLFKLNKNKLPKKESILNQTNN